MYCTLFTLISTFKPYFPYKQLFIFHTHCSSTPTHHMMMFQYCLSSQEFCNQEICSWDSPIKKNMQQFSFLILVTLVNALFSQVYPFEDPLFQYIVQFYCVCLFGILVFEFYFYSRY